MCIPYMMYYHAKQILCTHWVCGYTMLGLTYGCNEEDPHSKLDYVEELGRNFGGYSHKCGSSPTMGKCPIQTPVCSAKLNIYQ